jgi:hypothetical protein
MIINKQCHEAFDDMIEDLRTQLVIKKLTDMMLPDDWVYCVKGQHFVKKEDALMGEFDNPIEEQRETCYFCYEHYDEVNSILN